ncbi:hypothetical protein BH09PAT2_BH09PAT2_05560 [soil metagenome]
MQSVYFTASIAAKSQYIKNYRAIAEYLNRHNYSVVCDQIFNATEESVRLMERVDRLDFLHRVENWIKASSFVIAETSFPSVSVGYEIALALRLAKPVLVLYSEGDPPSLLKYHTYDRLYTEKYNLASVGTIIEDFIRYIEGKHDTRFTFFLPEELNAYLENSSKRRKMTKSMYIRQLLEKDLQTNPSI